MKNLGFLLLCILGMCMSQVTLADTQSTATIYEENCSECHRASNYSGGNANKLADRILERLTQPKVKHPIKRELTREEALSLARYMTSS